uniref:F-box domain-containing protein n=1 Tax=Meloidogyne javanica TaxID=6303 RepID=A0A915LE31_MELJA
MQSLPLELKLKVLKYLDYESLCSVNMVNRQFNAIINKYQEELPKKEFYSMELKPLSFLLATNTPKITAKISIKNNKLEKNWMGLLKNQRFNKFCLYISSTYEVYHMEPEFVRVLLILHPKQRTEKALWGVVNCCQRVGYGFTQKKSYYINIPFRLQTIEQVREAYYWLKQLSSCRFIHTGFDNFIFNPEMLKLIFGEDSELIQFYCKNAYLSLNEPKYNISALKFAADHLQKCGNLCLNVKGVNVDVLKVLLNNEVEITKVNINCASSIFDRSSRMPDLIIQHALTSTDCSKMIGEIKFHSIKWALPALISKAKKIDEGESLSSKKYIEKRKQHYQRKLNERFKFVKYELINKHNPRIKFLLTLWFPVGSEHISVFKIKRMN